MQITKWKQYKILMEDPELRVYLPVTKRFSECTLWEMVKEYKVVMIKPSRGRLGFNIYQVSQLNEVEDLYEVHHEGSIIKFAGKDETYSFIKSKIKPNRYIVQQKIHLIRAEQRLIDFRVMVQRRRNSPDWYVTGKFARLGLLRYIVTNAAKDILTVEDAMQKTSLNSGQIRKAIKVMDEIALSAIPHLTAIRPESRVIGFDFGVDEDGKVWIIEANFKPMVFPFKMLEDDSMYKTIESFKYGKENDTRRENHLPEQNKIYEYVKKQWQAAKN
ncbi:YheC/YheD family protein [Jeotgalibacillus proteolyticus]|uniref:ATP-grasp domain-containing protein n=1 Tax=Jeotgalibacillus proteolyticus TaxID=2082395 RepID=A0A2S5G836_9BACL|nr:YheC/YheD family protein [Jeotgalibacillus proteolyticus]PPA69138.1 hypothetical protein C4B60_17680 [Jeotgalibacillus proteolyticus]